ncbi:MAG: hypothetical protein M3N93_02860 [Acidobacteriota bacterium]|nr:hypothetical protein [Acidobacteriota bacterium]
MTPCIDGVGQGETIFWESRKIVASQSHAGVSFVIARMTFGRRLELMRKVRDLAARLEYFEAGREARNEMEASLLGAEIDRLYLLWGIEEIRGLKLDGVAATAESLMASGPEELFAEALAAVKAECGLDENERKN